MIKIIIYCYFVYLKSEKNQIIMFKAYINELLETQTDPRSKKL